MQCQGAAGSFVSLRGPARHAYLYRADSLDHRTITSTRGKPMRPLIVCTILAALIGVIDVRMAAAADADPVVGTWQLNPGKSTFKSGPAITNQTRTYSQSGDEITLEMKSVSADGKEIKSHTTY